MKRLAALLLLLFSAPAVAQAPGPGNSLATRYRIMGVSVSIPSIAASSATIVTANVPGLQVGDNVTVTLAAGSTVPPATTIVGAEFVTQAGVLSIKYANVSTLNASTATTVTLNLFVATAM